MSENVAERMLQNGTEVNGYQSQFRTDILKGGCDNDPDQDQEPDIQKIRLQSFIAQAIKRASADIQFEHYVQVNNIELSNSSGSYNIKAEYGTPPRLISISIS